MKICKAIISAALAAVMSVSAAAFTVNAADIRIGDVTTDVNITTALNSFDTDLELNKTYALPEIVSGLTGSGYKITVDNNNVVKIKDEKLYVVGTGKVTLTVTLKSGKQISKTFNVKPLQKDYDLSNTKIAMKVGQSKLLKEFMSQDIGAVNWTSSDDKVVSVDQNGKISAKKSGTAVIIAETAGGKKISYTINVGNTVPVQKVNINTYSLSLTVGESYQLHTSVSPSGATDKSVKCSSTNPDVAAVSYAKVTAKSVGTTDIVVKSSNGKSAVCKVTVSAAKKVPVTKVNINKTAITLKVGESYQLHTSVSPSNATDKSVKCSSTNTDVAAVSYAKVTAKAVGTANIIVKSSNGKSAVCKVTVISADTVPVTKVNINKTSITLKAGESYQLHTSVSPSNATDKSVKCSTTNEKVAAVSYAKITAKSAGTADIVVKSTNGKTAVCKVTVV